MTNVVVPGTSETCSRTWSVLALHLVPGLVLLPVYMAIAYAIHRVGGPAVLAWAVFVFSVIDPVISEPIRDRLFLRVPEWFDFAGQYREFGRFSLGWRVSTWAVGLVVGSITIPVLEELYFRGHLLPRLDHLGFAAPVINTVLFALYHVTWKTRSIIPAIAVHVALNLVGDTILSIPVVFS